LHGCVNVFILLDEPAVEAIWPHTFVKVGLADDGGNVGRREDAL
jgi:hypothetical protein